MNKDKLVIVEPAFTPGPWDWWDDGESLVLITEAAEQKFVAQATLPTNARLIAAAPALYEALAATVRELRVMLPLIHHAGTRNDIAAVVEQGEEAIALARGEQP